LHYFKNLYLLLAVRNWRLFIIISKQELICYPVIDNPKECNRIEQWYHDSEAETHTNQDENLRILGMNIKIISGVQLDVFLMVLALGGRSVLI
jgi:hypothetical protein